MKYVHYDKKTGKILGFYTEDIHGKLYESGKRNPRIPTDIIEITDKEWQRCLDEQGWWQIDLLTKKLAKRERPAAPQIETISHKGVTFEVTKHNVDLALLKLQLATLEANTTIDDIDIKDWKVLCAKLIRAYLKGEK